MILLARHKHLTLNTLLKCCVKAQMHRGDKLVISRVSSNAVTKVPQTNRKTSFRPIAKNR
jgi:hypothetical protein